MENTSLAKHVGECLFEHYEFFVESKSKENGYIINKLVTKANPSE